MSLGPMTAHPTPRAPVTLLACRCGTDIDPADGWMANGNGKLHYVHCPCCGHWAHGPTDTTAAIRWNRDAAPKGNAA